MQQKIIEIRTYSPSSKWYTFEHFCKDLLEDLGETVYSLISPKKINNYSFQVVVPTGVENRLQEAIKAKCWVNYYGYKSDYKIIENVALA